MNMYIDDNKSTFEMNMDRINQICGENFERKHRLFDLFKRYFSSYKYRDYEEEYTFKIDDEIVGRKYYKCCYIHKKEDIINEISLTKTSMMTSYIKQLLDEFDIQKELIKIDNNLSNIYLMLNEILTDELSNIAVDYDYSSIWEMVQKSKIQTDNGEDVSRLSNFQLLCTLLYLDGKLQEKEGGKRIILVEDIDNLISSEEYLKIIELCKLQITKYDSWYIFGISHDGFCKCSPDLMEGITVINDVDYSMDDLEHIWEFIKLNYPMDVNITKDSICNMLEKCVNSIGTKTYSGYGKSMIIDKLISKSLGVDKERLIRLNELEMTFLSE